jgi:hypothetical protein
MALINLYILFVVTAICWHPSLAQDIDSSKQSNPVITIWVEKKGSAPAYYVDRKDVTADPLRGIANAYETHAGAKAQYPVRAIIDDRLPLAMLDQVRGLVGKVGFTTVRYFLRRQGSLRIGEVMFGDVFTLPSSTEPRKLGKSHLNSKRVSSSCDSNCTEQ